MAVVGAIFRLSHSLSRLMVEAEFSLSHNRSLLMAVAEEVTFPLNLAHLAMIRARPRNFSVKWKTILRSIRSLIKLLPRFRPMRAA